MKLQLKDLIIWLAEHSDLSEAVVEVIPVDDNDDLHADLVIRAPGIEPKFLSKADDVATWMDE